MKYVFSLTVLLFSLLSFGQNTSDTSGKADTKVFAVVEQMPEFPGGDDAMIKFMQNNITYPDKEREKDIQGRVLVQFIVNLDGSLSDIKIKKGVSKGIDNEALRVVSLLPNFKPGMQQGKPVRVQYVLPIAFKLEGSKIAAHAASDQSARNGSTIELYNKGMQYKSDDNYPSAKSCFQRAADKHYPPALLELGYIFEYGRSVMQDYSKAFKYVSEAADSGNDDAQLELGYMYEKGWGTTADPVMAEKWYKKSADQNNRIAQSNIGYFYLEGLGGLPSLDSLARIYYMKSAESGYARAESQIGYMYEHGQGGLSVDTNKAYVWYLKAANQDYPYAMCRVGEFYLGGLVGLPKKEGIGISYIQKAADLGNSYAQFRLAYLYQEGKGGLDRDTDNALKWYDLSAKQGNNDSRNNYAWLCYIRKTNIPQALDYVKLSLEQSPNSMYRLDTYASLLFLQGEYEEAEKWQKKAMDNGGEKKGGYLERYGNILMMLKRKEDALKYWEMASKLDGHSDKLAEKIAKKKYIE